MRKAIAMLGVLISGFVVGGGVASAQTAGDPTNGAFTASIDSVKSWVSGVGAAPLFALAAVVLVIGVGLAWVRKARQQGA